MNTTNNLHENKKSQGDLWIELTVALNDNFKLNLDPREVYLIFHKEWQINKTQ